MYIGNAPFPPSPALGGRTYIGARPSGFTGDIPVNLAVFSMPNIILNATRWPVSYGMTPIAAAEVQYWIPQDCTIDFMSANVNANPAAAITVTLRKMGADTLNVVALGTGVQSGINTTPIHFRKGEWFSLRVVAGPLGISTIDGSICLRFVKYGTNQGLPCIWGTNLANMLGGMDMPNTIGTLTIATADIAFPATSIMVPINNVVIYRNGVALLVPTLPLEAMQEETPLDIPVGERFQIASWGSLTRAGVRTTQPLASTLYPKAHFILGASGQPQNTSRFFGGLGHPSGAVPSGSLVESEMQFIPPPCKMREWYSWINTTPPAGQTLTASVRKNGASVISNQFTNGSPTTMSETATEVTFNGTTDLCSFLSVTSATSGTRFSDHTIQIYRTDNN